MIECTEDKERKLSLVDYSKEYKNKIHEFKNMNSINFGLSYSQYFCHTNISTYDHKNYTLLEISPSIQDYIQLLIQFQSGEEQVYTLGDREPNPTEIESTYPYIVKIEKEPKEIFFRLDTHDGLYESVTLNLWNENAKAKNSKLETIFFFMYIGSLLSILIYNSLVYLGIKDRAYGYYIGFLFFVINWIMGYNGYYSTIFIEHKIFYSNNLLLITQGIGMGFFFRFSSTLLPLRDKERRNIVFISIFSFLLGLIGLSNFYSIPFLFYNCIFLNIIYTY
jgi:diguanylate cyclase